MLAGLPPEMAGIMSPGQHQPITDRQLGVEVGQEVDQEVGVRTGQTRASLCLVLPKPLKFVSSLLLNFC